MKMHQVSTGELWMCIGLGFLWGTALTFTTLAVFGF